MLGADYLKELEENPDNEPNIALMNTLEAIMNCGKRYSYATIMDHSIDLDKQILVAIQTWGPYQNYPSKYHFIFEQKDNSKNVVTAYIKTYYARGNHRHKWAAGSFIGYRYLEWTKLIKYIDTIYSYNKGYEYVILDKNISKKLIDIISKNAKTYKMFNNSGIKKTPDWYEES